MTQTQPIDATLRRWRAYAVLFAVWASLLALGLLFSRWLGPWMIVTAHRGEGFGFLTGLMGGLTQTPVESYLSDLHNLDRRMLVTAAGVLVYGLVWIRQGWSLERHWFAASPLRDLAIARIVLVATQLAILIRAGAILSRTDPIFYRPLYALRLLLTPFLWMDRPDAVFLHVTFVFAVVCGVAALFGLLTRISLFGLAWASSVRIAHSYSFGEYHHPEALMMVALWALAFSRSGAVLSLDSRIRRARGAAPANPRDQFALWPLRLVQWMFALTYFAAGAEKLVNGGLAWLKGTTLAFDFAYDALHRNHPLGIWLAERADWLPPLAAASLLFELTFPLAVLVPRLALWYAAFGIPFHLSVYVIHGPPFFEHMALYVVFLGAVREGLAALQGGVRRLR